MCARFLDQNNVQFVHHSTYYKRLLALLHEFIRPCMKQPAKKTCPDMIRKGFAPISVSEYYNLTQY